MLVYYRMHIIISGRSYQLEPRSACRKVVVGHPCMWHVVMATRRWSTPCIVLNILLQLLYTDVLVLIGLPPQLRSKLP